MRLKTIPVLLGLACCAPFATQVAWGQGIFGFKPGGAEAPVSGSAGPGGASQNAAPSLEKCESPFGTIAVVEPQADVIAILARYNL